MKLFDEKNLIQQLSIDSVIFGYKNKELKVLVPKMGFKKPLYSLPGGFVFQNESIDSAAKRILEERTSINDIYLEQFRVFGEVDRTNFDIIQHIDEMGSENFLKVGIDESDILWFSKRFVSIGYYALVDINKVSPKTTGFDDSIAWYGIKDLPKMIMDHNEMVNHALETLRQNLDQKLIGFNLLPETFTIKEVQELYEAVYDRPLARNNFQKKMLDLDVLERLEKKFTGAANKAPYLYRFKN
jgi:ADP-ribose pyrophosphatase YjhB (NUDIX family)